MQEFWQKTLLCMIKIVALSRSDAFFRLFRCLLPGYRCRSNMVKVPRQQGLRGYPTTVCVSPNNRLRIRKRPFAYTQKLLPTFFEGHCWGTVGAAFLANIAPEKYLYIRDFQRIGAHGAMIFSYFSIYILLPHAALHQFGVLALGPLVQLFSCRIWGKLGIIGEQLHGGITAF